MCTSCEQHMVMNFFRLESLKPCDYSFPIDIDICLRRLRHCYCLCTLCCIHCLPLCFLFPVSINHRPYAFLFCSFAFGCTMCGLGAAPDVSLCAGSRRSSSMRWCLCHRSVPSAWHPQHMTPTVCSWNDAFCQTRHDRLRFQFIALSMCDVGKLLTGLLVDARMCPVHEL